MMSATVQWNKMMWWKWLTHIWEKLWYSSNNQTAKSIERKRTKIMKTEKGQDIIIMMYATEQWYNEQLLIQLQVQKKWDNLQISQLQTL